MFRNAATIISGYIDSKKYGENLRNLEAFGIKALPKDTVKLPAFDVVKKEEPAPVPPTTTTTSTTIPKAPSQTAPSKPATSDG